MAKIDPGKYLTPKIIINISIILGFLLLVGWLLSTLSNELESKAQDVEEQKSEIASRIKSISDLAQLREDALEAQPAIGKLQNALPTRNQLVSVPRYLDTLARENSVTVRFNFVGEEVAPGENEAGHSSFTLNVIGNYGNILNFIEDLEKGSFLVKLDSFSITLERTNFDVDLRGIIYFGG